MLNLNKNRKSNTNLVKVMSFTILMITLISVSNLFAGTTYYSRSGQSNPNLTASWRTTTSGTSGSSPSNFTSGDVFIIQSGHTMTTTNDWSISGSGSSMTINGTLTLNHNLSIRTLTVASAGTLNANDKQISANTPGRTFTINGTLITSDVDGLSGSTSTTFSTSNSPTITISTGSTIKYNSTSAQNVTALSYSNVIISSNSIKSLQGTTTIGSSLSVESGSTLNFNGKTINFDGNSFTNNGTVSGSSTNSSLIIGGTGSILSIPALTLYDFTLNRASGLTLTGNVSISNSLILTNGLVNTGTNSMIFASTALNPTEISASRIIGNSVMQSRVIDQNEFTFLGATFGQTTQSLGAVTMTRITGPTAISNNSISCKWNIEAAVSPAQGRQMTYKWLSDYDNNRGFGDNNKAQVYFSIDNGLSWDVLGDMVNPIVNGSSVRQISIVTTHYSIWSVGAQNSPLPVTLSSFTSSVKNNNVTLNWATTSEINNKGFDIERAEANSNNYTKVGFVDGKGTTNNVSNYTYTDSKLNSGKYSYRIKQVDFNGNFEYFSLNSSIDISAPKKFTLSQNYPNPFNPSTKIDYEIPADSKVNITIYDISGKEVQQVVNEYQKAGYYTAQFNASRLSSGTYFYKLTTGNDIITKKMTLVK